MVDAVAARIAPSALELRQPASPSGAAAEVGGSAPPAAMVPAAPDQNDAVILDLSEQARAVLAQVNARDRTAPSAKAEDLAGLIQFEERFRLMSEYTALHQELAWLSERTAAYALDKTFQGAAAQQDESSDDASGQAELDRYVQRREELMPRFAELTRKLKALPGQEN